jgi:hypothetical protein
MEHAQASAAITSGLAQEVAWQLSKFKDIAVLQSVETALVKETLPPRFVLSGSLNLDAQADIARNVATSLAHTYGVISQADAALNVSNAPDDWAAYSCTLSYYAYRVSLDTARGIRARGHSGGGGASVRCRDQPFATSRRSEAHGKIPPRTTRTGSFAFTAWVDASAIVEQHFNKLSGMSAR